MSTSVSNPASTAPRVEHLRARVLSGSAIMLLSSVSVGGMNLFYNFAVAHKLGAGKFGHASVTYTLLMLLSSVTLSFQLVCSKFVARGETDADRFAIYHLLHRRAWMYSVSIGVLLVMAAPVISAYLNLPTSNFIRILAVGIVFYIPLGVRRGLYQGTYDFRPLALNFALEASIKLAGALALMSGGYGVEGVIGAMSASLVFAYFIAIPRHNSAIARTGDSSLRAGFDEGIQALVFFIGQVIINNLDILLVKHFFEADVAGTYAAVALVGRVVYILSWSVVNSMFPLSAGVRSGEKNRRAVLTTALSLVLGITLVFTLGAKLAPSALWKLLLGGGFPVLGSGYFSHLLILYVITTGIYSVGVVLMTYEISRKIGNVSWVQLAFSIAIILGIYRFHRNLEQVILVQLVAMLALLVRVVVPFSRSMHLENLVTNAGPHRIRKVDENEAIAEFLRGEFNQHHEFTNYRLPYAKLVAKPDLNNPEENAFRRALLYQRRGRLWRELPKDTEWWEVELTRQDVKRIRVFARNQWLRFGTRGFLLLDVAKRIRQRILSNSRQPFIVKLRSLSMEIAQEAQFSSVILITTGENAPLTIIEGNHRMAAAALVAPDSVHLRFRFLCGFSPRMATCCWYQSNFYTLLKYALHGVGYHLRYGRPMADLLNRSKDKVPSAESQITTR